MNNLKDLPKGLYKRMVLSDKAPDSYLIEILDAVKGMLYLVNYAEKSHGSDAPWEYKYKNIFWDVSDSNYLIIPHNSQVVIQG